MKKILLFLIILVNVVYSQTISWTTISARMHDSTATALRISKNLSDLANTATARINLGVYSTGAVDSFLGAKLDSSLATALLRGQWSSAYSHTLLTNNPHSVTATQVGLGNVTNESKATMFTKPIFTDTTTIATLKLGSTTITATGAELNLTHSLKSMAFADSTLFKNWITSTYAPLVSPSFTTPTLGVATSDTLTITALGYGYKLTPQSQGLMLRPTAANRRGELVLMPNGFGDVAMGELTIMNTDTKARPDSVEWLALFGAKTYYLLQSNVGVGGVRRPFYIDMMGGNPTVMFDTLGGVTFKRSVYLATDGGANKVFIGGGPDYGAYMLQNFGKSYFNKYAFFGDTVSMGGRLSVLQTVELAKNGGANKVFIGGGPDYGAYMFQNFGSSYFHGAATFEKTTFSDTLSSVNYIQNTGILKLTTLSTNGLTIETNSQTVLRLNNTEGSKNWAWVTNGVVGSDIELKISSTAGGDARTGVQAFYMNSALAATFAGSVTSAGLTLSSGDFTGNSVTRGTNAFTTTATADTVAITGASVNDIYMVNYITAVTAAEAPLSVVSTATGFIVTRPAGTTSGASYAWMRQK